MSPFQTVKEIEEYVDNQAEIKKIKEQREKDKKRNLEIVRSKVHAIDMIEKANNDKMVPFILSSKKKYMSLSGFINEVKDKYPDIVVFDVKEATAEPKTMPHKHNSLGASPKSVTYPELSPYFMKIKQGLAKCMAQGGLFVISLDDSLSMNAAGDSSPVNNSSPTNLQGEKTQSLPALKPLFHEQVLPASILNLAELNNNSVFMKVLANTQYAKLALDTQLHPQFRVCVWGKYKIDNPNPLRMEEITTKIHRKYSQAQGNGEGIDLSGINIIVWDEKVSVQD